MGQILIHVKDNGNVDFLIYDNSTPVSKRRLRKSLGAALRRVKGAKFVEVKIIPDYYLVSFQVSPKLDQDKVIMQMVDAIKLTLGWDTVTFSQVG